MPDFTSYDFTGKRALIRVDFNVPLNAEFHVTDDTRIRAALPTVQHILQNGGSVVLMSHLGRPKQGPEDKFSLRHIQSRLQELLGQEVDFGGDCIGDEAFAKTAALEAGKVVLLENLRFYKEETAGDRAFAEKLSAHGDVYVNDAFGTAHRAHASTTIVAEFFSENKLFGLLMGRELENIDRVLQSSESPYTAVIGGAKVSSKISIITNLLEKIDRLVIGGGMAYTFIKAQGGEIGNSLVEDDQLDTAKHVMARAAELGVTIHLPTDTIIADKFDNDAQRQTVAAAAIPEGWMGLDIGPETEEVYVQAILTSKTVLWNGPMGVFEFANFAGGTQSMAKALVGATDAGAFTLVGGGDSVAAINQFNAADQVSYVSTGGGALLEYMEGKELPGIAAIRK